MNTLFLGIILVIWLILAYKIYGTYLERKLIKPDDSRITPCMELHDGIDYSPAKTPLLFGHHFSSIAGAGPIVGPLIGVLYFGWVGAILWIGLGSVFLGAVHDYTSLMASVRNKGRSIADISEKYLGYRSKVIFSIFLWLALVLVIAVFAIVASQTLVKQPEIVIPTFGLIFIAMFFGWLVYRKGISVFAGTIISLIFLFLLIYLGEQFPLKIPETILGLSNVTFWFFILLIYSLFAASLPVWFLLQPRDYISTWILFLGLGFGYLGLIFAHPKVNAPAFTSFTTSQGPLWPMLFVLIACGAISGFHSLVAGGTTSKQLLKESKGKLIGYGAMLTETALAGLVILIASGALVWDPLCKNTKFGYQYLMKAVEQGGGGGPIVAFATGFGKFISSIPGFTFTIGLFFGMIMLNAFVLTTLDTSTRLTRFIIFELLGKKIPIFNNRWISSAIVIIFAGFLGVTESYKAIWPVFGASNQLVAALALVVVSAYFVGVKKPKKYTVYPAYFMLLTTIGALCYQGYNFFLRESYFLGIISTVLVLLAIFIIYDARKILFTQSKP